ncbi:hypothetical protein AB205_0120900 [Aquarana catesbeiana]|uniref:BED-type domain-containing protein n=1 Tax=Aquarana catesbeiana TaxID=8400 RepID=A0A2G9Q873_AQUCT|nr:hypothetical protein AB205_0120900 [Aquarana catesbeiana]
MFPQLQHTASFAPVMRREGMMRSTWVPDRREEEEEAHQQRGRMPSRGQLKGSILTASHHRAPHVQSAAVSVRYSKSSLVWAFFEMSASDPTAICNICLKRISRG